LVAAKAGSRPYSNLRIGRNGRSVLRILAAINTARDYIQGRARMGVFAASGQARTFDFEANDVGYVPFAMGHYIENTGNTTLRFLEIFKSDYYADVSLDQWLALTPPELVSAHLQAEPTLIRSLRKDKVPVVPA
jgi:oxalate decarboxylase